MEFLLSNSEKLGLVDCDKWEIIKPFCWRLNRGYAVAKINGVDCLMHRLVLGFRYKDGTIVDHINGNGLDNRLVNLRACSHAENMRNMKPHRRNKSGFKGVSFDTGKNPPYRATIYHGKQIYLGSYFCPIEAAHAYDKAAKELFKEFAYLNFPNQQESA